MMKYQKELEAYIDSKERDLVAATARLIAVPSTIGEATEEAPFGPGPLAAMKEGLAVAEEWGLITRNYDNYVGLADLNDKETNLHMLCHMDVVDPGDGWDTDPYQMVEKDGLIYGRGVDDDKGPAVISMLAMRAVKELGIPLKHNVRLVLGTDEETGSRDIAYYYAREPFAPYTFSPDSSFPVTNLEKGHYHPVISANWEEETALPRVTSIQGGIRINVVSPSAKATVKGLTVEAVERYLSETAAETHCGFKAEPCPCGEGIVISCQGANAHAASPDEGNNANTALLTLLARLPLADCPSTRAVEGLCDLFPHGDNRGKALGIALEDEISHNLTLTLSLLTLTETGFHTQFDARVPLCANDETCRFVCEAACAAKGFACEGEIGPAHYVPADSPFIKTLLECYENYSGLKGDCVAIGGGTYVHNIPGGVAFGACNPNFTSNLHAANERANISDMLTAAKIYAQAIVELCGE